MVEGGGERLSVVSKAGAGLDRPAGYFPRGTSLGFLGLTALAVGVPFSVLECAAPLLTGGFDAWLGSIPYVLGLGLLPIFVLIAGARSHRYWTVLFFFYVGAALLVAYGVAVLFALAGLAGVLPVREAGLHAMSVVGVVLLLGLGLPAKFLWRALRLRYWQPGSAPAMWEPGDEGPPAWALSSRRRDGRLGLLYAVDGSKYIGELSVNYRLTARRPSLFERSTWKVVPRCR